MASLDVFKADGFSMANLTEAINKLPHAPSILGDMGLFTEKPITTTVAHIEDKQGTLSLLNTAGRGSTKDVYSRPNRTVRDIQVPHVPYFGTIMADDVQNIRAFGSETELESVSEVVNDVLQSMRSDHEVTQEYHRIGAVQGQIKDGDGSTVIHNLFTIFSATEFSVDIDFSSGTDDIKHKTIQVIRQMSDSLGGTPFRGIVGICGDSYFDSLVTHASVTGAYDRWRDGEFLRVNQLGSDFHSTANGFSFGDIYWFNYRGSIGSTAFFPTDECRFIPLGVPSLFVDVVSPADFMETVNTRGRRFYAKTEMLPYDKGVELHTQSNVLSLCTRPSCLIKSTGTNLIS